MRKRVLIFAAALCLLVVVAVLVAPATHSTGRMNNFQFLIAVLNDASDRGLIEDRTSAVLSTWFVENVISPGTGEAPWQARTRIAGSSGDTPTPTRTAVMTLTPTTPTVTRTPTPTGTPTPAPPDDRAALVALYNFTNGANWTTRTNWLTSASISRWHGVTTDGSGRVIHLRLFNNGLAGSLPREIGRLDRMTELVLFGNGLTGSVPSEIGDLTRLTSLWLNSNKLTGSLPSSMSDLTNLTQIKLAGGNKFTGCVPWGLSGIANNDAAQLRLPECAPLTPIPTLTPTPTPVVTPTPTPPPGPPGAIAHLAVAHEGNRLWISWTPAIGVTWYQVDYRYDHDPENTWHTAATSHVGTTYTLAVAYANENDYYHVRVRAINSSGGSEWKYSAQADPHGPRFGPTRTPTPTPTPTPNPG